MRAGNFTSSEIYKLMSLAKDGKSFGKPALTYIQEKKMERKLGRSLHNFSTSKATSWGLLCESHVFDLLSTDYSLNSTELLSHSEIDCWKGSPDGLKYKDGKIEAVIDIKCPFTLKSFCELVDSGDISIVRDLHDSGEAYYWQLVSNSILSGVEKAELIVYCPYLSEIQTIRDLAEDSNDIRQWQFRWVASCDTDEMPYLLDKSAYKNLNKICFDIPESDKELLTEKVKQAQGLLELV